MMRRLAAPAVIALGVVLIACDPGIDITFVNNTDRELCFYESGFETPRRDDLDPSLCNEIPPQAKRSYGVICQSDWLMWVLLTDGVTGPQIYARAATCGEWEDTGATVTIEQLRGEFIVTDSLPDGSPTPEGD